MSKIQHEKRAKLKAAFRGLRIDTTERGNLRIDNGYHIAIVAPHPAGLVVTVNKQRHILPGELDFQRFTAWLTAQIGIQPHKQRIESNDKLFPNAQEFAEHIWRDTRLEVGRALRSSGVWKARGKSDPQCEAPKAFWKAFTIRNLEQLQAHKGPRYLWRCLLGDRHPRLLPSYNPQRYGRTEEPITVKHIRQQAMEEKAFEIGVFPESAWTIRKWQRVPIYDLARHAGNGLTRSPFWGMYVSHCWKFDEVLHQHNAFDGYATPGTPEAKMRDDLIVMLNRWPKTKAAITAIDNAFNNGIGVREMVALAPQGPADLRRLTELWLQVRKTSSNAKSLNASYVPPDIELPEGWSWVTHEDGHKMSEKYNCCFSKMPHYIDGICDGKAHAAYRTKIGGGDLGALAYLKWDEYDKRWCVQEIKGHSNKQPDRQYTNDMEALCRAMSVTRPGPHPIVPQSLERGLQTLVNAEPRVAMMNDLMRDPHRYYHAPILEKILENEGWELDDKEAMWTNSEERQRRAAAAQALEVDHLARELNGLQETPLQDAGPQTEVFAEDDFRRNRRLRFA